MDDRKVNSLFSLKAYFKKWILITSLSMSLFSVFIISLFAFFEAKDLQDETLVHFMNYTNDLSLTRQFEVGKPLGGCKEKEGIRDELIEFKNNIKDFFIEEKTRFDKECKSYDDTEIKAEKLIFKESPFFRLKPNTPEGYHTIIKDQAKWRILVGVKDEGRFVVGQKTEVRNEMVIGSAFSAFILLLIVGMILFMAIDWVLKSIFAPVKMVSLKLDEQNPYNLRPILMTNEIEEIRPFIKAINRLIEKVKEKGEKEKLFLSNASHELRTPITAIYLQFENLENAKSEKERSERIQSLKKGIEQVKTLLEQLLDLSKIQAVGIQGEKQVPMKGIIEEVVTLLFPLAEKKTIDLGIETIDIEKDFFINESLSHVLINALSNAIKYTPKGGKIDISVIAKADQFDIYVDDSGPGIPEEEKDKVLNAFYTISDYSGTGAGLGLSICHEIAQRLNCRIELSDSSLGGLRFRFFKFSTSIT